MMKVITGIFMGTIMWQLADALLSGISVVSRSLLKSVRWWGDGAKGYMTDTPMPLESAHPNAGLEDVEMSATDRRLILTQPWPARHDVPSEQKAKVVFGDPSGGNPKATKAVYSWEAQYLSVLRGLPGAWNNSHSPRLYVHKFMAPYLLEALTRLQKAGLIHEIETIGCFNYRRRRHSTDPEVDLSWHASAVAIDVNSAKNFAVYNRKTRQSARHLPVGKPWSKEWMAIWPQGLSEDIVLAFESVGFKWGGRWKDFIDPMHFELVA